MNAVESVLVSEGLDLLDKAAMSFDSSSHPMVDVMLKLIHSAIVIGKSVLGENNAQ